MIATVHQPDFLPWCGFFNKIAKSDCWVVLDHVENNPRDAAFWGRRVKLLVNGQPNWLSITINKPNMPGVIGVPIREMTINSTDIKTNVNCIKTIEMAYKKAPFFQEYFHLVENYFADTECNLMLRNMSFIVNVMSLLKMNTKIVYSSTLNTQTKSTELLIELLQKIEADTYLCGGGAQGYLKEELFVQNSINLQYNNFKHPVYPQFKVSEFVPGLSILDALFMVGEETVSSWMVN